MALVLRETRRDCLLDGRVEPLLFVERIPNMPLRHGPLRVRPRPHGPNSPLDRLLNQLHTLHQMRARVREELSSEKFLAELGFVQKGNSRGVSEL